MGRDYSEDDDLEDDFYDSGNVRDMHQDPRAQIGSNSGMEPDDAIDDLNLDDLMKEARKDLFADLLRGLRSGMLTPAEKNVLRQLLKDNGMVMGDPNEGASEEPKRPKADLPSFSDPEYNR
ncbi:hypothetical protein H7H48_15815 [Nitratireductor sp. B36]|uniref:hypothetical protein n=1 Tax=Nitratireductor sp. B36 TaxID=2762059 RepID=UPI001E503BF4|nr:hypothetical protein [Nitratireductor sp. B36]MCC5780528.1 hypothetical protein [Nitratireductor sp. B36]